MLKDALPREWRGPSQLVSLYGNLGQSVSFALITLYDTLGHLKRGKEVRTLNRMSTVF
jgi:hypothetical protein